MTLTKVDDSTVLETKTVEITYDKEELTREIEMMEGEIATLQAEIAKKQEKLDVLTAVEK